MAEIKTQKNTREFRSTPYANIDTNAGKYTRRRTHTLATALGHLGTELDNMDQEEGKVAAAQMAANMKRDISALQIGAEGTAKNGVISGDVLAKMDTLSPTANAKSLNGMTIREATTAIHMAYDGKAASEMSKTGHKMFSDGTIDSRVSDDIKSHVIYRGQKVKHIDYQADKTYGIASASIAKSTKPISAGFTGEESAEGTFAAFTGNGYISAIDNQKKLDAAYVTITTASFEGALRQNQADTVLTQLGVDAKAMAEAKPEQLASWGVYWDKEGESYKTKDGTSFTLAELGISGKVDKLKGVKLLDPLVKEQYIRKALKGLGDKQSANLSMLKERVTNNMVITMKGPLSAEKDAEYREDIRKYTSALPKSKNKEGIDVMVSYLMAKKFAGSVQGFSDMTPTEQTERRTELEKDIATFNKELILGVRGQSQDIQAYVKGPEHLANMKQQVLGLYDKAMAVDATARKDIGAYNVNKDSAINKAYKNVYSTQKTLRGVDANKTLVTSQGGKPPQTLVHMGYRAAKAAADASHAYASMQYNKQNKQGVGLFDMKLLPDATVVATVKNLNGAITTGDLKTIEQGIQNSKSLYGGNTANPHWAMKSSFLRQAKGLQPIARAVLRYGNDPELLGAQLLRNSSNKKEIYGLAEKTGLAAKVDKAIRGHNSLTSDKAVMQGNLGAKDRLTYMTEMDEIVRIGALEFLHTESAAEAVDKAYDKYMPSYYANKQTRGVLGNFLITPDMVRNTMIPQVDIPDAIGVINEKIQKSAIKLEPRTMEVLAKMEGVRSWNEIPVDRRGNILANQRFSSYVTVATDGTLSAFSSVTGAPIKFKVGNMTEYSYHMLPDQIGYSATRVERRKFRARTNKNPIPATASRFQ